MNHRWSYMVKSYKGELWLTTSPELNATKTTLWYSSFDHCHFGFVCSIDAGLCCLNIL